MHRRVKNIEEVTASLKPFLEQYLQEFDIDTSKNFKCINPKHDDTNASMSIKGDTEYHTANCFGQCGCTADIFTAAHFLENKPIKGPGFIEENVKYLADKFGVKLQLEDLTPEEVYEYKTYEAYKYASKLISDRSFGDYSLVDKEIERRKWDKDKCANWGIGTVSNEEYRSKMYAAGYDYDFLKGVDLASKTLFNNDNLLFTVYDDFGRPVGFSAKKLIIKNDSTPRYINTRGTGLECAIFKKGERLYGFDIAKNAHSPLYIFEGQADVITARHHGIMNCCCTLGTALSEHHINLLKRHSIFNIVLTFDSDKAGEAAAIKALDNKFATHKEFNIKIAELPDGEDPDELLRNHGSGEFIRLKKWTAFEWRMMKFIEEIGDDIDDGKRREIAQKMSQIIVSEKSYIRQEEMARQVAKMTGHSLQVIMSEVKRIRNEKDAQVQEKKVAAVQSILYKIEHNPEELEFALTECQMAINDINKENIDKGDSKGVLDFVLSLKEEDEKRGVEFAGYKTRPEGLSILTNNLYDDWSSGRLFYIGGSPQSAKTTICTQMAYEIATCNKDVICIYHTVDDAAKLILYKWIAQAHNELKLQINHISHPNYWSMQEGNGWIKDERELAYKKVIKLIKEQRLVLADASDGASFVYALSLARQIKEKYPTKKILLFCDNFHKYPDFSELGDTGKTKKLSNVMKTATVAENITIVSTVEYKKMEPGQKPANHCISQARALEYDADVILHMYNQVFYDGDQSELVHEYNNKILPRIWCKYGKNKISGYTDREFLDLYPYHATLRGVEKEVALEEYKERKAYLAENKDSKW